MFEVIKPGDTVYVDVRVSCGWNSGRWFRVAKKVDRTTKTQFIIGDARYRKDGGCRIGGSTLDRATKEGVDQSKEMTEYKKLVIVSAYVNAFRLDKRIEPEDKNLLRICSYMKSIKLLLEDK